MRGVRLQPEGCELMRESMDRHDEPQPSGWKAEATPNGCYAFRTMNGLFAAVATPIDAAGRVDMATFDRLLEFLLAAGVDGVVRGRGDR